MGKLHLRCKTCNLEFQAGVVFDKKALNRLGLREIATLVLMDISINTIVKITTSNKNDYERLIHLILPSSPFSNLSICFDVRS